MAQTQATLVIIKPDVIARGLTGAVLSRVEQLGLELVGAKAMRVSRQLAEEHYHQLRAKPFFQDLLQHLCGELHGVHYVVALVYRGPDAIAKVRKLAGATNPEAAELTSLRGAYGRMTTKGIMENVVHASSDEADAEREIALWFKPEELLVPLSEITGKAAERG